MNLIKGKVKPEISLGYCLSRRKYERKRRKATQRKAARTALGTAAKAHVAGP